MKVQQTNKETKQNEKVNNSATTQQQQKMQSSNASRGIVNKALIVITFVTDSFDFIVIVACQ